MIKSTVKTDNIKDVVPWIYSVLFKIPRVLNIEAIIHSQHNHTLVVVVSYIESEID